VNESEGGEKMKEKLFGVFISIFVVAMLALPMSAVYAKPVDKFVEVKGAFYPGGPFESFEIREAGKSDNQIWEFVMPQVWVGGILGTGLLEARYVVHNFDDAEFWVNVLGLITLTGTVADVPGTVTIKFSSVSSRGGHWRIISGTGELANVHGQGTVWVIDSENLVIGYEGVIHFHP
jgi:hypothetical protein